MSGRYDIQQGNRQRQLVILSSALLLAIGCTFVGFRLLTLGFAHPPLPALCLALLVGLNLVYLRLGGTTSRASWALFGILLFSLISVGVNSGGFHGPAVLLSPILPVLAALIMNSRVAWVASVIVLGVLATLFFLEYNGVLLPSPQSEQALLVSRFIALVSAVLVCTTVVWLFSRDQQALMRLLDDQANTDYLTGLANRRSIESAMDREAQRARRSNSWLSLILADVDHFKKYNDYNGHQAGDDCLVEVGNVLRSCAKRPVDLCGRYGGEEFLVMLPETGPDGAQLVADAIRREMLHRQLRYRPHSPESVSLTLGVVSVRGNDLESAEQVLQEADNALYEGKHNGRNRVIRKTLAAPAPMLRAAGRAG